MAAIIRSYRNGIDPINGASRDDLREGDLVLLASVDPATTYSWILAFAPEGSTATFTGSSTAASPGSFTVDKEGSYLIRLTVDASLPGEDTQYVRLRFLTVFGNLHLVAAGERRDGLIIPVDVDAEGWANEQNANLQTLLAFVQKVSSSGRILYVDQNLGTEGYADFDSIQDAIDSISTATVTTPWIIAIRPGSYAEDLTLKDHVHLVGWPGNLDGGTTDIVSIIGNHSAPISGLASIANVHIKTTATSPSATLSKTTSGELRLYRCTLSQEGVSPTQGPTVALQGGTLRAEACTIQHTSAGAADRVAFSQNNSTTTSVFVHTDITGPTATDINPGAFSNVVTLFKDCEVSASGLGSYALKSNANTLLLEHCKISSALGGAVGIHPLGDTLTGNVEATIRYTVVDGNILYDTTGVIGTTELSMGSVEYDNLVLPGGVPTRQALTQSTTLYYDNTVSGLVSENVQDAIDELAAGGGGGTQDLNTTLGFGNVTGGINIEISSGDSIVGESSVGVGGNLPLTAGTATGGGPLPGGNVIVTPGAGVGGGNDGEMVLRNPGGDSVGISVVGASTVKFDVEGGGGLALEYDAVTGKLTVPGVIDPTALVLEASPAPTTGATEGGIFVSDGTGGLTSGKLYYRGFSDGTPAEVVSGGIEVQEETVTVGTRSKINFLGSAVTAVDNIGTSTVDVTVSAATLTSSTPAAITPDNAGSAGVAVDAARADHAHPITADTPVGTSNANSEGVSTAFARADHVHLGPWYNIGSVITPSNILHKVAIGTTSMVDEESLRVLGDTRLEGNVFVDGQLEMTNNQKLFFGTTNTYVAGNGAGGGDLIFGAVDQIQAKPGGTLTAILPTDGGLTFQEQASSPVITAGQGSYWVKNTAPSSPMFTDDTGVSKTVLASSVWAFDDSTSKFYATTGLPRIELGGGSPANSLATGSPTGGIYPVTLNAGGAINLNAGTGATPDGDVVIKRNGTTYVTFDGSAERVGIGTTTPAQPLHVAGYIRVNSGDQLEFGGPTSFIKGSSAVGGDITINSVDDILFQNAAVTYVAFDGSTQRVGIGTLAPNEALEVVGSVRLSSILDLGDGSAAAVSAAGRGKIRYNNTTQKMQVSENGGAYIDWSQSLPQGYIDACNVTAGGGLVTVSVGACKDSTNTVDLVVASTISINPTVVGANGRDTAAALTTNQWAVHVIATAGGTIAGLVSLSDTAPTMPVGYIYRRLVGHFFYAGGVQTSIQFGKGSLRRTTYPGSFTQSSVGVISASHSYAAYVPANANSVTFFVDYFTPAPIATTTTFDFQFGTYGTNSPWRGFPAILPTAGFSRSFPAGEVLITAGNSRIFTATRIGGTGTGFTFISFLSGYQEAV